MKIGYVGMFKFPEGNAGGLHVLGMGKAFREYGHEVVYFGIEESPRKTDEPADRESRRDCHDGFRYRSSGYGSSSKFQELKRKVSIKTAASFLQRLEMEEKENGRFDAIVVYHPESLWILRLLRWCRARRIPLICDVVEWYERSHIRGGKYGYRALDSEFRMRKGHALADGILAISTYLEKFYSRRGVPTLRVPNLIDMSEDKWNIRKDGRTKPAPEKLRLAFVGTAGQKDYLTSAIRGLVLVDPQKLEIVAVGPSPDELRANLGRDSGLLDNLEKSLCFTGMLPHREALRELAAADYSILLRPDAKFAHAGFPTKLVESLAMGVPMICNLTGDIGLYLQDGCEGIVVKDCSPEAFAEGLRRILLLSPEERLAMRCHARQRAEESFDFRKWAEPAGAFVGKIISTARQI